MARQIEEAPPEGGARWLGFKPVRAVLVAVPLLVLLAVGGLSQKGSATMNPNASGVPITYDTLFRNAESVRGTSVRLWGRIVQVVSNGGEYQFRVDVEPDRYGFSTKTVFVWGYRGPRLLEQDAVDIVGIADGIESYTAVLGNPVDLPSVQAQSVVLSAKPWPTFSVPSF